MSYKKEASLSRGEKMKGYGKEESGKPASYEHKGLAANTANPDFGKTDMSTQTGTTRKVK